jgi:hypothetical protein
MTSLEIKTMTNPEHENYKKLFHSIHINIVLKHRVTTQILYNNGVIIGAAPHLYNAKNIYQYEDPLAYDGPLCTADMHLYDRIYTYDGDEKSEKLDIFDLMKMRIIKSVLSYNKIPIKYVENRSSDIEVDVQKVIYKNKIKKYDWKPHVLCLIPDIKNIIDKYVGYVELEHLVSNYTNEINLVKLMDLPITYIEQGDMIGYQILTHLIQSYNDTIDCMFRAIYTNMNMNNRDELTHSSAHASYYMYVHMRNGNVPEL